MSEAVLYEKRDRIAYVTLNRPEAKNAVDPAMHEALLGVWADYDDWPRAVRRLAGPADSPPALMPRAGWLIPGF